LTKLGRPEVLMQMAHGFTREVPAGLVLDGLASVAPVSMQAGGAGGRGHPATDHRRGTAGVDWKSGVGLALAQLAAASALSSHIPGA
jgi:hypothetical protein